MYDYLLSEENTKFRAEIREFVKSAVPPSLLKKMDKDEVQYPREWLHALAKHNLIGIRFPKEYGGRGLNWESEIIAQEEIGVLGSSKLSISISVIKRFILSLASALENAPPIPFAAPVIKQFFPSKSFTNLNSNINIRKECNS